jgi:hypothetical protein
VVAVANQFGDVPANVVENMAEAALANDKDAIAAARTGWDGGGDRPRRSRRKFWPAPELVGEWTGLVRTYEKDIPISLSFKESGAVEMRLGGKGPYSVDYPALINGWFAASSAARLDTLDGRARPQHHVLLDLKLRGDVLNGAIGTEIGNAIYYWTELRKK